jgi:hypothetical protein
VTDDLKQKRKDVAREVIPSLEAAFQDGWRSSATRDESWFFLLRSPRRLWSMARDDVATIARRDIRRFHVINQLADCSKMNSEYYIPNVPTPLREKFYSGGPEDCGRPLIIQVDHCSVHRSAAIEPFMSDHQMTRMPQPPYCPDLAPSNFYLFDRVKKRLEQIQACDADNFFDQLDEILSSISPEELERVFAAWIDRVRQARDGDGEYLPS